MRSEQLSQKHARRASVWQHWALNIGAILGSLCLLMALCTILFGLKPLIFASGSMGPEIPTGALGLAIPTATSEIQPGEIVSVVNSEGTRVTHRVVENEPSGLILKGDANEVADFQQYVVDSVDRLLFAVPVLGYVISWFSQPWAFFVGGLLCAYLLYLAFRKSDLDREGGEPNSVASFASSESQVDIGSTGPAKSRRRLLFGLKISAGAAVIVLVFTLSAGQVERTQAAFSAAAQGSAKVTAAVMKPPANVNCTQGTTGTQAARRESIIFSWNPPESGVVPPTGYNVSVQVNNQDGSPSNNKITDKSLAAHTHSYGLNISEKDGILGSLLGLVTDLLIGYNYTVTVKINAQYPSGWSSEPVVFSQVNATNGGLLGAAKRLTCTLQ